MYYSAMNATLNIRLNDNLSEFVQRNVGDHGDYDNVSEFIRDLIRKEKQRQEARNFETVKRHLQEAFAEPAENAVPLNREDFFHRAKERADKRHLKQAPNQRAQPTPRASEPKRSPEPAN